MRLARLLCALALSCPPAALHAEGLAGLSRSLELMEQASRLVRYGREERDPLALIVAARLLRDSGAEPGRLRPGQGPLVEDPAFPPPKALATEAKRLAARRSAAARLADDFLASGEKGRESGPLYEIAKIGAGASESFPAIRFAGGKRAEIYVESTRKVGLAVFDAENRAICRDDRGSEVAYCWWPQQAPGLVRVEVTNRSGEAATYRLVTN